MKLLSEVLRQLTPTTLSLFGCALLAGPVLASMLGNPVYYWDMAYCMSFMLSALIYTSGQRVSAKESSQTEDEAVAKSRFVSTKWFGYILAFAVVLAGSVFFSHPQSTIATKMTYLVGGVVLPIAVFFAANWVRKKLAGTQP